MFFVTQPPRKLMETYQCMKCNPWSVAMWANNILSLSGWHSDIKRATVMNINNNNFKTYKVQISIYR